jgi:choice-of-anchor B domain-containing protein
MVANLSSLLVAALAIAAPILAPDTPDRANSPARLAGFGAAVATDGTRIFVGNPDEFAFFPMPPANAPQVHVFVPGPAAVGLNEPGSAEPGSASSSASSGDGAPAGGWVEQAAISVPEAGLGDGFGLALDARDGWLLVGAPNTDEGRGAAYLLRERAEGDWATVAIVTLPETGDAARDAALGSSVVIGDDWFAVGAPGAGAGQGQVLVHALPDPAAAGELAAPVVLSASFGDAGAPGDEAAVTRFGAALATEGGLLAVGAPGPGLAELQGGATPEPGAVFVFAAGDAGWSPTARLDSPGTGPAMFGAALHLSSEGELFAGAPLAGSGRGAVERFVAAGSDEGSAESVAAVWTHAGTLSAGEGLPGQAFVGMTLAATDEQLLAGAPIASTVVGFAADEAGVWAEVSRAAPAGPGGSFFGVALAALGDRFVVGAPGASIYAGLGFVYAWSEGEGEGAGEWTLESELADQPESLTAYADDEPAACEDGQAGAFGCADVDLVTFVPLDALGAERGVMVNDIWGWTDPETGHEWALVGRTDGLSFIDITDPAAPFYAGELMLTEGASSNIWRDMKVYSNHVFVVADAAGQHGMQVFDLTQLRDVTPDQAPLAFDESAIYTEIASAHNIIINEDSGFAYLVGGSSGGTTCGGGLHMVDIRDPLNPTFAGCFAEVGTGRSGTGTSHDAQCVNYHGPDEDFAGREICFGANETALSIADVTDKNAPVSIATATYPNSAYLHQGWISDDHRWFYMNDELDELGGQVSRTRTLVWNIEELDDPILVNEHLGTNPASDHNLYVRGDYMYQSNYVSGLRILDISDPENPQEVGYFDTVVAGPDAPGFAGSWSNFPYFESGKIIVTSMREGLFVVRHRPRPTVF